MATIAKKCSICGKMYPAYNYIDIPVSREDEEDPIYEDDDGNLINYEADDSGVLIDYQPNAFEFVTIKEDMDIQYDFDNQDLCPECMAVISNFIDTNTPHASGNPVVLEDAAPANAVSVEVTGGNENTIIVRTSKNLAKFCPEDNKDSVAFDYEVNEPNNIVCTKTLGGGQFFAVFKAYLKKDVAYKFSHTINNLTVYLYSDKIWGELITSFAIGEEGITYTSDRTGEIVIGCWCPGSATNMVLTDFMICVDTPPLVLRGIPKLDANNNLYYDGDTYEADGTVTRKYGVVDLGTLNWSFDSTNNAFQSQALVKTGTEGTPIICDRYVARPYGYNGSYSTEDKIIYVHAGSGSLKVRDSSYTDAATFKTAMSGVMLVYELATPTKENVKSFINQQKVSKYGTEEYVTTGIVPVGHITKYPVRSQENIDQTPYLYRASGGSVEVGKIEADKIVGGTVAFNQQIRNGNFTNGDAWPKTSGIALSVSSNIGTLTTSEDGDKFVVDTFTDRVPIGHKVLYWVEAKTNAIPSGDSFNVMAVFFFGWASTYKEMRAIDDNWHTYSGVVDIGAPIGQNARYVMMRLCCRKTVITNQYKNVQVYDLTAMFGSAVADMIYNMETANAGSGVAYFRSLFPNDYYEYNTGELKSVEGLQSHDMVGFNQWDEQWEVGVLNSNGTVGTGNRVVSKNFIPIIPNEKYCYSKSDTNDGRSAFYDANKNLIVYYVNFAYDKKYTVDGRSVLEFTTPQNACFMKFCTSMKYGTTYKNDICINISSDRNGEYEPYVKHSYPLNDAWGSVYEFCNEKTYTVGDDIRLLTGSNTLTASEGTISIKYKKAIEGKMEVES